MNDTSAGIRFAGQARGCRLAFDERAKPRLVSTLPPVEVRERLAALRRPQRQDDLPPRWFMDHVKGHPLYATVQVDAIRRLGATPDGAGLYLVPTTGKPFPTAPPPGCLRTLTPRQREREEMLQARMRRHARTLSMTLFALDRQGRSGGTASSFDLASYRRNQQSYGSLGDRVIGMVPDGVAEVELRFARGIRRVVDVRHNVWVTTVPRAHRTRLRQAIWRDADGRVMRRLR